MPTPFRPSLGMPKVVSAVHQSAGSTLEKQTTQDCQGKDREQSGFLDAVFTGWARRMPRGLTPAEEVDINNVETTVRYQSNYICIVIGTT